VFVKREKGGFTLIELLVVIAIIAILAAILFPVFSRAREQARKAACLSNAKQIGMALAMYAQDWDESLPFWRTPCWNDPNHPRGGLHWSEQLQPYIKNWDIYRCPSASQEWEWPANCYPGSVGRPQNNNRNNYGFNECIMNHNNCNGKNVGRLSSLTSPAETVVIADCWNNFLTPWARDWTSNWIEVRVAFANGPGQGLQCGCPPKILDFNVASEMLARHTGGSNLIFADGHAKWYKADQIKDRAGGGTLRMCGQSL